MMFQRQFKIGAPRFALAMMAGLLPCILGAMAYLTDQVDAHVRADEQKMVAYGVSGWVGDAEAKVVGQADWDDALQNLGQKFDANWAHIFIGQFLFDVAGMERAYVVAGDGTPLYASLRGRDLPPSDFTAIAASAAELLGGLRGEERRLHARVDFGRTLARPIRKSSLKVIEGRLYLVTATLVQSDFGRVRLPGAAPIVVTLEAMDQTFLQRFSDHFLLQDLRVDAGSQDLAPRGAASVALTGADGGRIGAISWTPHTPGRQLFLTLLVPVLGLLSAFITAAWYLDRHERRASEALMTSERRSKHLAFHDSLTGLPNRAMFNETMVTALADLRRSSRCFGLLAIDLDGFKLINDTYGHGAGDELIVAVAARLVSLASSGETVARLGGDEFAFVCPVTSREGLESKAHELMDKLAHPIELPIGQLLTGASIGGALVDDACADGGEALRQADVALYAAKANGRGRYCLFDPRMDHERRARSAIEADLRKALVSRQLTLAYQPQVDARGRIQGVEALLRWTHPERGPISPADFVPIAEECGLITPLGEFVMRQAFADSLRWPGVKVAINVSAMQFRSPGFSASVMEVLKASGANPRQIEIEITERILLDQDEHTLNILKTLRELGFTLALDDFGTGYSSLSYLRRYPVDKIKIDRSFITSLGLEPQSEKLISAIVRLAGALDLDVVAEGVETLVQREALFRAGCRNFQGYLFHRPMAADTVSALLLRAPRPLATSLAG